MRNRMTFLSCAVVVAAGLVDATLAMAGGSYCPVQVQTPTVLAGPCPVASLTAPACVTSGDWTGIEYEVPGGLASDAVSTLITVNNAANVASFPGPYSLKGDCTTSNGGGDLTTDLGEYSCHERALKVTIGTITKPDNVTTTTGFWVFVKGQKQPLPTSISQKRGFFCPIKSTQVLGLGLDIPAGCISSCGNFNPHQGVSSGQVITWEGCQITKYTDPTTGAFQGVDVTGVGCYVDVGKVGQDGPQPITGLMLGTENLTFGDGTATSGSGSCFNVFVGGVYSRICR